MSDSNFAICTHCNRKISSYSGLCRRKILFSHSSNHQKNKFNDRSIPTNKVNNKSSGNSKFDEFIKETQDNSKYCDDFIEWIPNNYFGNIKYLTEGGNSNIFCGTWSVTNLTIPLAIKVIKDSEEQILNEFKMHHECRGQSVIPFYGITKISEKNKYAMVIRRAEHGDLRNYIHESFTKLTWADKIEILINISKALKSIHEKNLVHRDFHCKNILVDEERKILVSDFGLCKPVDPEIVSDKIQGVLPYIAPEILKKKPYTKQSEVYSLSMIMWELTTNKPPFYDLNHDISLVIAVHNGLRPPITEETPEFYAEFMKQCWDPDPLKRPDASHLPELFEEMMILCNKMISPNTSLIRNMERNIKTKTETKIFNYTTSIVPIDFCEKERASVTNDEFVDIKPLPHSIIPIDSREKNTEPGYESATQTLEYITSIASIDFSKNEDIKLPPSQSNLSTDSKEKSTEPDEGAIGIIKLELVEAKGLISVDSFFAGEKSYPYVRVFHEGDQDIIAQTKFIDNNLDPIWNEIHYLPVKNIGDKFILDVMDFAFTKDNLLGHYTFEVTDELVKEVSPNVYEGTSNDIDKWVNLSIQGKLHYRAKFYPLTLNALPKPTPDFLANLKEKPFDKSTLYILIALQAPNGSFPPSTTLANLLGYSDTEEVFNLYKNHVYDERVVNNINKTIWTTSMVQWFLSYLLKEHRSEWCSIYMRSERYITKELGGDLEIKKIVIASGRKAIYERFEIEVVDEKQIIIQKHIKASDIICMIRHQTSIGAFQASDELAKLLSFNSSGQLCIALTRHINSQSKNAKITNYKIQVWVTILVLYYFRLVGVDHKTEWEESYLRAYKCLWVQFKGKEKIEQEAFKIIESFVKERYSVKDVDNSSEDYYSSSASSFVDESKKISFEDNKEERNLSSPKRKKRNSFISLLNPKKDDKEKEEKEEKEKHSEGLVRTLSGIFNKDKDNSKRNNTVESEKQVRPTSCTSSNSDTKRHSYIFFSEDDEKPENDTTSKKGTKSRQSSNSESLEKDKSSKIVNRISVNLGKFFENKSSPKTQDIFEDSFLEPGETIIKSPKKGHGNKNSNNDINNNSNNYNNYNNNDNNNVESPQIINGTDNPFPPKSTDYSPVDNVQSTISSTSSFNNNVNNKHESEYNSGSPTTPITPRLIVTPIEPEITNNSDNRNQVEFEDEKEDQVDQNNAVDSINRSKSYEGKERNVVPLTISTNNIKSNYVEFRKRNSDDTITNTIEQQKNGYGSNSTKTLQELEEINKSLNNVKVSEQDIQITKYNSMKHIMQQQIDLSKRMTEAMQRLESKVNVQKDEVDGTSVSKMFEETIKRLETKIDRQNDEIILLKSVVGQLSGESRQLLLTNGNGSRLRITQDEDQNRMTLIQANPSQSPQIYSKGTLVSTLVVKPLYNTITVSASIATSVLYAVYVRPVVGLVSVLRDGISTTSLKINSDELGETLKDNYKKEKENAIITVKSSTITKKAKEIVSSQKEDGSLELTDTISKELDIESKDSLISYVKPYFSNKGTKITSTNSLLELKEKAEKAEKYLKTQADDNEIEDIEDSRYHTQTYNFSLDDLN